MINLPFSKILNSRTSCSFSLVQVTKWQSGKGRCGEALEHNKPLNTLPNVSVICLSFGEKMYVLKLQLYKMAYLKVVCNKGGKKCHLEEYHPTTDLYKPQGKVSDGSPPAAELLKYSLLSL